jgi:hypothetical protein
MDIKIIGGGTYLYKMKTAIRQSRWSFWRIALGGLFLLIIITLNGCKAAGCGCPMY